MPYLRRLLRCFLDLLAVFSLTKRLWLGCVRRRLRVVASGGEWLAVVQSRFGRLIRSALLFFYGNFQNGRKFSF